MSERVDPGFFEGLYQASEDPWDFATSEYEAAKYDATIAALGERRFERGLELGCSIGVLTQRLAERCDELVAVDGSPTAVARARERLAQTPNVDVREAVLPEGSPSGTWDLIVCSEVLYYFDAELLATLLDALEGALRPGGVLLAVHWRPRSPTYPLSGDEVHTILDARAALELTDRTVEDRYRLDAFTSKKR